MVIESENDMTESHSPVAADAALGIVTVYSSFSLWKFS
jgi:hypothetical protein